MTTPSSPRDVVVVVNRHSRRADAAIGRLHEALQARGLHVTAFHPVRNHDEAVKLVKRAAKAGAPAVIAGGGDGTMGHIVDALAHSDTVLGVLPLGTGNSFARSLSIPPNDLDAAVAVIAAGHTQRIDLGCVNGTHFANFATIGLSSAIANATQHRWKAWLGTIAYGIASLGPLFGHAAFRATIRWHGGKLRLHTQDIVIANGRYFGSTAVSDDASLESGRFALYTVDERSALGALKVYVAMGAGKQLLLRDAHLIESAEIRIRTHPRQDIALDGSLFEKTPARFHVARKALRVFVPAGGVAR